MISFTVNKVLFAGLSFSRYYLKLMRVSSGDVFFYIYYK